MAPKLSEHNLFITTAKIPRTFVGDLPSNLVLEYVPITGWRLFERDEIDPEFDRLIAAEVFGGGNGLRLDVDGLVICDM